MLVPASSAVAVATTSAGAALAQSARVIALRSGDENTAANTTVSSADHHDGDDEFLDQVVRTRGEQMRVRCPVTAPRATHSLVLSCRASGDTGRGDTGRLVGRLDRLLRGLGGERGVRAGGLWWHCVERRHHTVPADQDHVQHDEHTDDQRQQHDVPQQHLARSPAR